MLTKDCANLTLFDKALVDAGSNIFYSLIIKFQYIFGHAGCGRSDGFGVAACGL